MDSAGMKKDEDDVGSDNFIPTKRVKLSNEDSIKSSPSKRVKIERKIDITAESPKKSPAKKKTLKKTEVDFEPINRWWEKVDDGLDDGHQWTYLEHNGIMFTPSYVPHGIAMKYSGERFVLPPDAEEVASFWCGVLGTDYAENSKFIKNFWLAFTQKLPSWHPIQSGNLEKCDFSEMKAYFDNEKERKKSLSKEEKEEIKRQKLEAEAPYGYALVDWLREKVGNSKVEPPGLFRGRGDHPKQGQLKGRIFPENVTLNCSEDAPVPHIEADSMPGHCWGDVYHDNKVTWLAFYKDSINDQYKYMYLAAQSKFKGMGDLQKYEKARKLKHHVEKVRENYCQKMRSNDITDRQLGTATYLIDFLALRVGGEKDTDEEADTVGCCSLRVEHVQLDDENDQITLDFLGKDSIRYYNTVKINPQAYGNMKLFCKGKKPDDNIFNKISCASLNNYLKELMDGLTAKVFRTYNASITLQKELVKINKAQIDMGNVDQLLEFYNNANREVAILCNHQRSVPKQHEASMEKLNKRLELLNEDIRECEEYLKHVQSGKTSKFKFKSEVKLEDQPRKNVTKEGMKAEICANKIKALKSKKAKLELSIRSKDDNKTVSLGTSKINYMDPRITVAFCKTYEINIEKCFNRSLRLKFPWAMFAKMDFEF